MDRFHVFVPKLLPKQECFMPNSPCSCKGCGEAMAVRHVYKALGGEAVKKGTWKIPWKQKIADLEGAREREVFLPALLKIPKSGKKILSICFDNEAHLSETELGKQFWKKFMPAIAAADGIPYVATACPSYPFDLITKAKKAYTTDGDAYLHILCPCPAGWDFEPKLSVKIGKFAVESHIFPLYEIVENNVFLTINTAAPRTVKSYCMLQGRFKHFSDGLLEEIDTMVKHERAKLTAKQQEKVI